MINIITRTCNRPIRFKINVDSVKNQTYCDYKHIICVDNNSSEEYVRENGFTDYILLDGDKIRRDNQPEDRRKRYMPYNLYMNECHKKVDDGWVIYMDDDDSFQDKTSLKRLNDMINSCDEDTLIFFQTMYPNRSILPDVVNDNTPPMLGKIGGSCFTFHSKWIKDATWDEFACGDYRVITRLMGAIPKYRFFREIIIAIGGVGSGNKRDY